MRQCYLIMNSRGYLWVYDISLLLPSVGFSVTWINLGWAPRVSSLSGLPVFPLYFPHAHTQAPSHPRVWVSSWLKGKVPLGCFWLHLGGCGFIESTELEEGREQVSEKDRKPPPSRHEYIHESGGFLEGLQSAHRRGGGKSKIWVSMGFVSGGAQSWRCIMNAYESVEEQSWLKSLHSLTPHFCNILTNFLSLLVITRRVLLCGGLLLLGVQTGFFPSWVLSVFAVIGWHHTTHCCCRISLWLGIFCINFPTLGLFRSKWGQFPLNSTNLEALWAKWGICAAPLTDSALFVWSDFSFFLNKSLILRGSWHLLEVGGPIFETPKNILGQLVLSRKFLAEEWDHRPAVLSWYCFLAAPTLTDPWETLI